MANSSCSNAYPSTDVLYIEVQDDLASIVLFVIVCFMVVVCLGVYAEELIFLRRVNGWGTKSRRVATILGLHPVTIISAFLAVMVPKSTLFVDFVASCYLTVCYYTFFNIVIGYFGDENKMVEYFQGDKIQTSVPPCCCCCCCVLKPRILTLNSLLVFKYLTLQVVYVRPILLFIALVLWTDGKFVSGLISADTSYIYIMVLTSVSTLFSLYGTFVVHRASAPHLQQYRIMNKFLSIQLVLVLSNMQGLLFSSLAANGIPGCIQSRGPIPRANALNHFALIIETFLLCLLARRAYRMDERNIPKPTKSHAKDCAVTAFTDVIVKEPSCPHMSDVTVIESS
ncbi:organic solute transporter subunit alpha-like [Dreissena polymorpha]|uniref:Organic solute transporter subunit alpha n=1 Tax=Dreissena polymorpha TaxID=45954 RepID=A0A9D4RQA4_DREPO|nr:organic solute transporter subunit alpha-like [Dreissena polymorpha]XP_052267682.1 organic solute transporter subunit alpha-like [Dreissena polymorpha]XP_052267683.1 organic solute transporter subunit alpha-like [Dreissena polymorpha]XP_052267684.1 organic solute transporter subunit alpha-like [Dreissena polymorpha]XP_052267685.1 organic solute transporter subunit alpha-like [Dreissena polymorpha]KAH3874740.1 hypothetical protein DPMN_037993 [Dreissena polymorpha]